jgi:hypothetical protein
MKWAAAADDKPVLRCVLERPLIALSILNSEDTPKPETAWLYTKGPESVRMEALRHRDSFELSISGPGKKRTVLEFGDSAALTVYQTEYESRLVTEGYTLEQYISERRRVPRGQV